MSDWAGIKKAVNSDLSKPLNELINGFNYKNITIKSISSSSQTTITGRGIIICPNTTGADIMLMKIDGINYGSPVDGMVIPFYKNIVFQSMDFEHKILVMLAD